MAQRTVSGDRGRQASTTAIGIGFAVLCLSYLLNAMDRQVFYPLLPEIREEYAFSLDQSGLLATGFTLGLALTGIPAGYLLDRMSRRTIVVVSVVVYSLGTTAIPLAAGFADMAVYRLVSGIGEGVQATAIYAVIGAFFFHRRALAAGFIGLAFGLGVFLGPVIGQALAAAGGTWRTPFYVFGVVGLVMAAVILVTVPRAMSEAVAGRGAAAGAGDFDHVPAGPYNRNTLAFGTTSAVSGLVFYGFLGLYPTFLREQLGFDPGQAALAASLIGFGAMTALPVGWLADRVDQRILMAVGFVGTSLAALLAYQLATGALAQYVLAFLIGTFASGVLFTNCTTVLQRSVRPEHVGRGAGLFTLTYYVAAAVSGLLFARLVAGLGWSGAGLVQLTLLPLVGLAALALVDPRRMLLPPAVRARLRPAR
ncbi:MFS transporter [Pseudonocardia kunmingensis]|uniref:Sugar phosphate permease n=1 Tax=Pseudonocardia kunmingensis TaxID=630975 RepID=A0A543DRU6_9PSEU|nr:MFS transporter [Pseudonocardia kunmingensis]TQM12048.1 sugar phosphate permease [Pseudonocardia kunmingensis]